MFMMTTGTLAVSLFVLLIAVLFYSIVSKNLFYHKHTSNLRNYRWVWCFLFYFRSNVVDGTSERLITSTWETKITGWNAGVGIPRTNQKTTKQKWIY